MFGWIHQSIRILIERKYGVDTWMKIIGIAGFVSGEESKIDRYYKDEETFKLVHAVASVAGMPVEEVWEAYGAFLIQFTMETGWDELLRCLASDLQGFLDSLDSLHYFIDRVVYKAQLKGPSFRCEADGEGTLILHYYSKRTGLYPIVKGVVREVARRLFNTEVVMKVTERKQEHLDEGDVTEHVIFHITEVGATLPMLNDQKSSNSQTSMLSRVSVSGQYGDAYLGDVNMSLSDFRSMFPYHICFNSHLYVEYFGDNIRRQFPQCSAHRTMLTDIVELEHPSIPFTFDNFVSYINSMFVFRLKSAEEVDSIEKWKPTTGTSSTTEAVEDNAVFLKGQMVLLEGGSTILYITTPNVTSVQELHQRNLYMSDLPKHDATRDLILVNQSRMSQQELNKRLEEGTEALKQMTNTLDEERRFTEQLLSELLPNTVADALRNGQSVAAREFDQVTVVFTDIVTFTNICSACTPFDVIGLLTDMYMRFDRLTELNKVFKVETIGDAYMVVGGCPEETADHAEAMLNMAIGMIAETALVKSPVANKPIQIRAGVHTGPVIAGVVGKKMPRYCLFGETVTVGNRIEATSVPSRIHLTNATFRSVEAQKPGCFIVEERGWMDIHGGTGKEKMFTYFLVKNNRMSVWEITNRQRGEGQSSDGYSELEAHCKLQHSIEKEADKAKTKEGKEKATKKEREAGKPPAVVRAISANDRTTIGKKTPNGGGPRRIARSTTCTVL